MDVVRKFFSVLHWCWSFDWPSETIVRIAELVRQVFERLFLQLCGVVNYRVVNRQSCGSGWICVCNHEKVIDFITIFFNDYIVDKRSRTRIDVMTIGWLKESCGDFLVDQAIHQLWIVISNAVSDGRFNFINFNSHHFFSKSWSTNTVSINDDESWLLPLVYISVMSEGFLHKTLKNLGSVNGDLFLLIIFCHFSFFQIFFVEILVLRFWVMLC